MMLTYRCPRRISGSCNTGAHRMHREKVERIIAKFGSQQRVAELLGIWQTAVSGWVRRGTIPAKRQIELLAIARARSIELAPHDFFLLDELPATGTDGRAVPVPHAERVQETAGGGATVIQWERREPPA